MADIDLKSNIYPELPLIEGATGNQSTENLQNPQAYRLKEISEVKEFFLKEIEHRNKILMKYKKAFSALTWTNHTLNGLSIASGAVGLSALVGVLTAPAGLVLTGIGIGSAVISSTLLQVLKKWGIKKLTKHEKIYVLAVSKLDSVSDLLSKAVSDSRITHDEFKLILNEKEKYIILKNTIRRETRNLGPKPDINIEEIQKTFLDKGRKLAQVEMIQKLKDA